MPSIRTDRPGGPGGGASVPADSTAGNRGSAPSDPGFGPGSQGGEAAVPADSTAGSRGTAPNTGPGRGTPGGEGGPAAVPMDATAGVRGADPTDVRSRMASTD